MAAKKARKRAYIPPSAEVINRRERTETTRSVRTTAPRSARGTRAPQAYPTPSIKRTLKRLPIYLLMIFALQYYLLGNGKNAVSGSERLLIAGGQAFVVTLCFAPFMHVMDRMAYNRYLKRTGQQPSEKS